MKRISWLVLMFLCFGVEAKSFYLIRHAEKLNDGSKDPVLTLKGQLRAQNIAHILSHTGITKVFATEYQRTQMTAKPMADLIGVNVTSYNPSDLLAFAEQMHAQDESVLIVGHSNTTPQLVKLLSGEPVIKLTEADFDYIFQVVIEEGQTSLNILKSLPVH